MQTHDETPLTIGLLWRGDPDATPPSPEQTRYADIFAALERSGARARPVLYADHHAARLRPQLLVLDGLLVWVNPISPEGDRSRLDALLREVAGSGVAVSAHPDIIAKMGTKEVLVTTRSLGWGTDARLYSSQAAFHRDFPGELRRGGTRVLKEVRGNDGLGVWRIRASTAGKVEVLHAKRGSQAETVALSDFMARWDDYFAAGGRLVDQPYLPRLAEGMIRCYVAQDRVVGFGLQKVRALLDSAAPPPRTYQPETLPEGQRLRRLMEEDWIPGLKALLSIADDDLPALWDADFLLGARSECGEDRYALCEINVSSVAPYPPSAAEAVAAVAVHRARAARERRRASPAG